MVYGSQYPICADYRGPVEISHTNIDEQASRLTGYGQRYEQLSAGRFQGKFLTCQYDDEFSVYIEHVNRSLLQRFDVPEDRYAVCLMMGSRDLTWINGTAVTNYQPMILPPGAHAMVSTGETMKVCVVSIDRGLFEKNLLFDAITGGRAPEELLHLWDLNSQASPKLLKIIHRSMERLSALDSMESEEFQAMVHADKIAIVSAILTLFAHGPSICAVERRSLVSRDIAMFDSLASSIERALPDMTNIGDLYGGIGAGRRKIEMTFKKLLNVSPYQYVKTLRLNRARRDLQSLEKRGLSIADIAADQGLRHVGRFARDYYRLFDELPSETRLHAARKNTPRPH